MHKTKSIKQTFKRAVASALCLVLASPFVTQEALANISDSLRNMEGIQKTRSGLASDSVEPVGLRLVVSFDSSNSLTQREYLAQKEALADTIGSEDFKDAIFSKGGPQSLAITFIEFSSDATVRIGWTDVRQGDEWKLKSLADEVRNLQRLFRSGTDHAKSLKQAMGALESCPWRSERNAINVITDGIHNTRSVRPRAHTRNDAELQGLLKTLAEEYGATVNVLVTTDDPRMKMFEVDMEKWALRNLATPNIYKKSNGVPLPGGFVDKVATEKSEESRAGLQQYKHKMRLAFRHTLIREVVQWREKQNMPGMLSVRFE